MDAETGSDRAATKLGLAWSCRAGARLRRCRHICRACPQVRRKVDL